MPLSNYFKGKGSSVMESMQKEYGEEKGKKVFYATAQKKKNAMKMPEMGMKEHLMMMKQKGKLKGKK